MNSPEPITCVGFVLVSFILAGIVQTVWYKTAWSKRFAIAIDGGRTFQGHRILGENKTLRGFVVMVPAVGTAFVVVRVLFESVGLSADNLWLMSLMEYFWLGCWAGFGFMIGEFPNSFFKRRWEVEPGAAPRHPVARASCFFIDQIDSILGGLIAAAIFVPVPLLSWILVVFFGSTIHWAFNLLFVMIGLKARAA
ncbi:MAG: CDP-archaeol synthase [Planctomycetota bacterium]